MREHLTSVLVKHADNLCAAVCLFLFFRFWCVCQRPFQAVRVAACFAERDFSFRFGETLVTHLWKFIAKARIISCVGNGRKIGFFHAVEDIGIGVFGSRYL